MSKSTTQKNSFPVDISSELKTISWFTAFICVMVSLTSYHPEDASFFQWVSDSTPTHNLLGRLGAHFSDFLFQLIGFAAWLVPYFLIERVYKKEGHFLGRWLILLQVTFVLVSASLIKQISGLPIEESLSGGLWGELTYQLGVHTVGYYGSLILGSALLVALSILIYQWKPQLVARLVIKKTKELFFKLSTELTSIGQNLIKRIRPKTENLYQALPAPAIPISQNQTATSFSQEIIIESQEESTDPEPEITPPHEINQKKAETPAASIDPEYKNYQLPPLSLLKNEIKVASHDVDREWHIEKAKLLVEKLGDFGVQGDVVNISPGPVITIYEFQPASGVKIREIANLTDDLTLALSAMSVRIVAPIPGKPVVGIEIPSHTRESVFFKDIIKETNFYQAERALPIALGRLANGEPLLADLAKMPHLLVAGATGTGKSVFVNTLILSLLYRFRPDELKLILVDPKMVELSHFEGVPHLLLPVVVDSKDSVKSLNWLVNEMERRYQVMHKHGVRNIQGYNKKMSANEITNEDGEELKKMPFIVTVIDEYADLMSVVSKQVELSVTRLAQKARASGIHLVLATQRPSADVVTGIIKANFPSRISFRVASSIDSKTILDRTGAERLLGQGDLLYYSAGFTSLKRVQGSFIPDLDLDEAVSYLKSQGTPEYATEIIESEEYDSLTSDKNKEKDALFQKAVELLREKQEASISLIQRHLKIGYNRAAQIMEELEKHGMVGPQDSTSKRRSVLIGPLTSLSIMFYFVSQSGILTAI